jgi:hypothetical protein
LINKILNSKSLSKEIYHLFISKDVINIDSINSLIKWKSEVGEINLENVLKNLSIISYIESYQQTCVWLLRLGLKNRISVTSIIIPQTDITLYMVIYGYAP